MTPGTPATCHPALPRRTCILASVLVCGLALGSCGGPDASPLEPRATIRELMSAIVDPAADGLWDAVEVDATLAGVRRKAPSSDDEWAALERHAIALIESSNLLLLPGRQVAHPGDRAEDPRIDRHPEEIQTLRTQDPASWEQGAVLLREAAAQSLTAARSRNVEELLTAGDALDKACENCHARYWYRTAPGAP